MERVWDLAILLGQGMQVGLAERGLTLARAHLIWQLQQDGPSTQRSLSRALRVTPRNVTGLVDALEAEGLVSRGEHPTDRRATLVSLTPNGVAKAAEMQKGQHELARALFHDLAEDELATFGATLDRIVSRIRELMPRQP